MREEVKILVAKGGFCRPGNYKKGGMESPSHTPKV
jgi:hypothetical protein